MAGIVIIFSRKDVLLRTSQEQGRKALFVFGPFLFFVGLFHATTQRRNARALFNFRLIYLKRWGVFFFILKKWHIVHVAMAYIKSALLNRAALCVLA